jgi:hypothetical protein
MELPTTNHQPTTISKLLTVASENTDARIAVQQLIGRESAVIVEFVYLVLGWFAAGYECSADQCR